MKLVSLFPSRVVATIALAVCSTLAIASPGSPAPPAGGIKIATPEIQIASPGSPAPPAGGIKFMAGSVVIAS